MNKISMKKAMDDYRLYVFDLDGTLYFQKAFRIRMLIYLFWHVLFHPASIKDIFILKTYRKIREDWEKRETDEVGKLIPKELSMEDRQYEYVAKIKGVSKNKVSAAVDFFMMKAPLSLLPDFADEELKKIILSIRKTGRIAVIYSDYPVEDKLKALNVEADGMYTSSDERIGTMKPDAKGLQVILADYNFDKEDVLMIGDRYEKDGLAAKANGVDYLILPSKKSERDRLYKEI